MARKMQNLFDNKMYYLKNSVVFPVLFFRSKSVKYWKKSIPADTRKEMESLCFSKTHDILQKIQPKKILILGFRTYSVLKKSNFYEISDEKSIYSTKQRRLAYISFLDKIPTFSILHPTGSRISNTDWQKIKTRFYKFLDSN